MVAVKRRAPRSANPAVGFSLPEFVSELGKAIGAELCFDGPGPLKCSQGGRDPTSPGYFAVKYLAEELFSKFDDRTASSDKWDRCLSRFYEAEALCGETNARFRDRSELFQGNLSPDFSASKTMWSARWKIQWLLGEYDDSKVKDYMGFGPGATTRLPRRQCDLGYKLGGIPQATKAAIPFIRDILSDFPSWELELSRNGAMCEVVHGNKIVGVPKNYKTDRMIAIEPDWNMFLQKGIGGYMRKKLRSVGIDLSDQSNNATAAEIGSRDGSLATIDLSMASDCVSYELVRFMLPPDWFDALEQCRSPVGVLPSGEVVNFQKFSSMGNGYTFELETLIFWAIAQSVIESEGLEDRRIWVYGDDIVVPSALSERVCVALQFAGFMTNEKKTFSVGPFRESCGSHFFDGFDVSPFYVREPVDRLDRLFLLHNNCARWFERTFYSGVTYQSEKVHDLLAWIRTHAPESWQKPRLPRLDIGDGAFYGCFEMSTPSRLRHGLEGWNVRTLQSEVKTVGISEKGPPHATLLKGLYNLERSSVEEYFLLDVEFLALARNRVKFPAAWREPRGGETAGLTDILQTQDLRWFSSNQRVMSLATHYCWWEVALLLP